MTTFLDALAATLRARADYNASQETAPAAVLWPDAARQWEPIVPTLRDEMPVVSLGPYDPEIATGLGAWIRCAIAEANNATSRRHAPVVYLPGFSARHLRAVDTCPHELTLLAELQFRGAVWRQPDGNDWTVAAYLHRSDGGLGIELKDDALTPAAAAHALPELALVPVQELRDNAPLRAVDFKSIERGGRPVDEISLTELIALGESATLEFKSSFRYSLETKSPDEKVLLGGPIKSVAAFLNSTRGGTLLVGVADDGTPLGLESDLSLFPKDKRSFDALELWFWSQLYKWFDGKACASFVRISFPEIDGKHIAKITVSHGNAPTFVVQGKGETFYLRSGNRTDALGPRDMIAYIQSAWS